MATTLTKPTLGDHIETLDRTIGTIESMLEHRRQSPIEKSDELYYELVIKHLRGYRNAKVDGVPIVSGAGGEILDAMGLQGWGASAMAVAMGNTQGLHQDLLEASMETGLRPYLCDAVARYPWGAVVRGYVPPPDLLAGSSTYCNTIALSSEFWADWLGVPHFRFDRPLRYTEEAVRYHADELKNYIQWLEEHTGHKMDWERLEQNVENTRQMLVLKREIHEMRKAVPTPLRSRQCSYLEVIEIYWRGRPEAVQYFQLVRDEMKERFEKKKGFISEERFRLLCFYVPPTYCMKILDWWERAWGAVSVMEPLFLFNPRQEEDKMDPKKPLESISRAAWFTGICSYFYMPAEITVEDFVRFAKEYKVDGGVWYVPILCRQHHGLIRMVKDALKREANVPVLTVDVGYIDPTYCPEEELRDKTESFFEMLEERKESGD